MRALLIVVALTGCLRSTQFQCELDTQCGSDGRCEAQGYCSFVDASCPGQRRFASSAGPLAGRCVGDVPVVDAGIDAPTDGRVSRCPAGYVTLAGTPANRRYLAVNDTTNWNGAESTCADTAPGHAYLAIPDDAAELAAIHGLLGGEHWLGINDQTTENEFRNVLGVVQTFLPWAPGEPDNIGGGGQDCVQAVDATRIATRKCSDALRAVCECEED